MFWIRSKKPANMSLKQVQRQAKKQHDDSRHTYELCFYPVSSHPCYLPTLLCSMSEKNKKTIRVEVQPYPSGCFCPAAVCLGFFCLLIQEPECSPKAFIRFLVAPSARLKNLDLVAAEMRARSHQDRLPNQPLSYRSQTILVCTNCLLLLPSLEAWIRCLCTTWDLLLSSSAHFPTAPAASHSTQPAGAASLLLYCSVPALLKAREWFLKDLPNQSLPLECRLAVSAPFIKSKQHFLVHAHTLFEICYCIN